MISDYIQVSVQNVTQKNDELEAVRTGNLKAVKKFILNGQWKIDEVINKDSGHTLIHLSVVCGYEDIFDFLVSQGANVDVKDFSGYTPMLKAASLGRNSIIEKLIGLGVDPRATDPYG